MSRKEFHQSGREAPGAIQKAEKRGGNLIKECLQQQMGMGTRQGQDLLHTQWLPVCPQGSPGPRATNPPELHACVGNSRSQTNNPLGFSLTCPEEKNPTVVNEPVEVVLCFTWLHLV